MNLNAYEYLIRNESMARKYLLGFCWKFQQRFCPRCHHRKNYRLEDRRRRCARCGYTFHDFTGRWINRNQITCRDWLRILKLFELEISIRKMAHQLALSYSAVYKAITTIRLAILAHDSPELLKGEIEMDESYFGGRRKGNRGRGATGKVPVFGILERKGQVFVEVVPDLKAQTVLGWTLKKVRRGSIVYTDKYRIYDALMFCGYRHLKVDHQKYFSQGKVYINGLEGFWSYAKERMMKYHGISSHRFPLYLKELEFRYNHRYEEIYSVIAKYLCDFVPKFS